MTGSPVVLLVNNSRETFTPTASGAIATCLWELANAAPAPGTVHVVSTDHADDPYGWPRLHLVPAVVPLHERGRAGRAGRRLSGWAHPGQSAFARAALRTAREVGATTVVCNNDPEIAVHLARRLPDVEVIHWFHNLEVATDGVRRRLAASPRVRVVAVSAYLARAVEGVYRLGTGRVDVARNGVDSTRFAPDGSARPGEAPVVGFLGRVAVEKGVDLVLDAAGVLADRGVPHALLLVGDTNWHGNDGGPYGRRIAEQVAALRERGADVTTTGHVGRAELPAVLRRMDVQVLSSRWDEPCALTVLEGMASGNALVGTSTGGTPELVGDAGVLVPREDATAIADAVEAVLAEPGRAGALGRAARARAEEMGWDRTWAALLGSAEHVARRTPAATS